MTPRELLVQLREKGVEIKSNGDRLVIDAPKGAITPDVRDALAANKAELLKILNTPPPTERPVSPAPTQEPPAPTRVEDPVVTTSTAAPPARAQSVAPPASAPVRPAPPAPLPAASNRNMCGAGTDRIFGPALSAEG